MTEGALAAIGPARLCGLGWFAVVTDGVGADAADAADAQVLLALGVVLTLGAVVLLTVWWRRAGRPRR